MTQVVDFIDIRITRESTAVSRTSLDVPMFMAAHTAFAERARVYTSIESVAEDFRAGSNVYKAASRFFGQEVRPPRIVIGRVQAPNVVVTPTVANTAVYRFVVQGETISFTSDASATATEIVTGLKTAFDAAGVVGVTMTVATSSFTIAPTVSGSGYEFKPVTDNLVAVSGSPTESPVDALNAIVFENSDFIAVTSEYKTDAAIEALADAVEAMDRVYVVSSDAAAITTNVDTDIISKLKAKGYEKTFAFYSGDAVSYPECALLGLLLPENPGSYTAKFKSLTGVAADKLTDTQTLNIKGKNGNTYETVGGVNMVSEGVMTNGAFFDEVIGTIALKIRLRERVYFRLANSKKISYTRAGFTILENDVRAVLSDFVGFGFLADTPVPTVTVPDPLSISPEIRATRVLDQIQFRANLASAVHKVIIRGVLEI